MEEKERVLAEKLFSENPRYRLLYEEHLILEKELKQLDDRPHLTPEDEVQRKKVQKLKLAGKDEMERIMSDYR